MRWLPGLLLAALLAVPAAQAQEETVTLSIGRFVELVDEETVEASLTVTCSPGDEVLEAFVYVVQRAHNSEFGFFGPICDGTQHTFAVTIHAGEDERFRPGRARVSAFVLLESGATTSPSQKVVIKPGH
jgi:hypothetical protein